MNLITEQLDTEQRLVQWETMIEVNEWDHKQDIDKISSAYHEIFAGSMLVESGKQPTQKMSQARAGRLIEDIKKIKESIKKEAQLYKNL